MLQAPSARSTPHHGTGGRAANCSRHPDTEKTQEAREDEGRDRERTASPVSRYNRTTVVRFTERGVLETHPGADWRPLVLKRTSRLIAAVSVPGVLIVAAAPGPYGLCERMSLVAIAAA